jgi:magnesium transporter
MQDEVVTVRADQDQEDVARELAKYDFLALPVVDNENRIIGIITHDDVLDVLEEEATEDAFHMAGVGAMEENYLDMPFMAVWRKRSLWLSCLFVAQLFTFTVMAQYEGAIASIFVLSLFLPLCISTGGNSGSQAATLITRAMALGQIAPREWWRVFRHELLMGVVLGLTLGVIGFLRAVLTPESVLRTASGNLIDSWTLAVVISSSVALICLWGTIVGSMLPLTFKKLGFDPGYASTPFVATIVDVTGIAIYFSIASWFLL